MKIIFRYIIILVSVSTVFLLPSCVEDTWEGNEPQRTVLVYIAMENSLSNYASQNLGGMIRGAVGSLNGGNLLVYMDTPYSPPCLLRVFAADHYELSISVDTIKVYEEHNSVDIDVMKMILDDVFKNPKFATPSKGLILSSHGTGWLPQDTQNLLRIWGQDTSTSGNFMMELNSLRDALVDYQGTDKFDFIIFDACYMSSIEVFYALRNNSTYIMGSPTEVIGDGLPYSKIIKPMFAESTDIEKNIIETGRVFYDHYNAQQLPSGTPSASVAVVKTTELNPLAEISKEIFSGRYSSDALNVDLSKIQIMEHLGMSSYNLLYDFSDFTKQLATTEQYDRYRSALDKAVIYKETTAAAFYGYPSGSGSWYAIDKDHFCGLSSYVPQSRISKLNDWYKQLDWYKATFE